MSSLYGSIIIKLTYLRRILVVLTYTLKYYNTFEYLLTTKPLAANAI